MPDELDHEVIDSPQALFRHLYEAHGVVEALDLDPATAPLQFWLRRHTELERAATGAAAQHQTASRDQAATQHRSAARNRVAPQDRVAASDRVAARDRVAAQVASGSSAAGSATLGAAPGHPRASERPHPAGSGPRFRPFADPLVEALAAALVGRGMDERWVRRGLSTFTGAGGRHGEEAVRAAFVAPMVDAVAAHLAGESPATAQRAPLAATAPPEAAGAGPASRTSAGREPTDRLPAPSDPEPRAPTRREPAPPDPAASEPTGRERAARDPATVRAAQATAAQAAWVAQPLAARTAGPEPGADIMAIADVLQERRRLRRGGRRDSTPRPVNAAPLANPPAATPPAREPDDDVMALADALQRRRRTRTGPH